MQICEKSTSLMEATLSKQCSCWLHDQLDLCWWELASRGTNEELEEQQEIQCYKAEAAIEPKINTNVENFL